MSKPHVIIIGGGVGGLAAGVRLGARGVRVTLLEKNPRVGGKLNLWEAPHPDRPTERPFRFDTGPSLLTLPLVFEDLFAAAGEDVRNFLPITKLDPISRFVWPHDGSHFDLRANVVDAEREVARFAGQEAVAGWRKLLAHGQRVWDLGADFFLQHAPEQMFRGPQRPSLLAGLKMLALPFRIGMFGTFKKLVDRHIGDPRLRAVFYQYATYSGASPAFAPATFSVIPYTEMGFGGWYVPGGLYRIAEALETAARKLGVEVRTNAAVESILVAPAGNAKQPRAAGVRLAGGEEIAGDAIIANSDVVYTYRHLVPPQYRRTFSDAKLDAMDPGGSGLVLLLGIEGTYPRLAHHTKFMPVDYAADLRAMFETRTMPADPCIYVCASTRTDASAAPAGCENLFVLASAPPIELGPDGKPTIDWAVEGPRYRDQLVRTLEQRCGLTDLSRRIVVEHMLTPAGLQHLYNANAGSIYGLGANSRRGAFRRPPNRDRDMAGLFFAGGATHPGGGLPLVALSGKIVSELVCDALASGTPAILGR